MNAIGHGHGSLPLGQDRWEKLDYSKTKCKNLKARRCDLKSLKIEFLDPPNTSTMSGSIATGAAVVAGLIPGAPGDPRAKSDP